MSYGCHIGAAVLWHIGQPLTQIIALVAHGGSGLDTDIEFLIETWMMILYKKPLSNIRENRIFNLNLSRIHIKSECAIGYLKGRLHFKETMSLDPWAGGCIICNSLG